MFNISTKKAKIISLLLFIYVIRNILNNEIYLKNRSMTFF